VLKIIRLLKAPKMGVFAAKSCFVEKKPKMSVLK